MRQPSSIHHLQGQLLAIQAQLNALFASLPPVILESVQEHLQRQADLARVEIISTEWGGPVMQAFESALPEGQAAERLGEALLRSKEGSTSSPLASANSAIRSA